MVFVSPLKDTTTFEEFTVALECELSEPDRTVTWYKDGKQLPEDRRVKSSASGAVHTLTIRKTNVGDAGEYSAVIGGEKTKAQLVVKETEANITKPLKDVSVRASEDLTLVCELSKPNRKVTWLKNGKEVVPGDGVEVKTEGTKQILTVKKVDNKGAGEYSCRCGEEITSGEVAVLGKTAFLSSTLLLTHLFELASHWLGWIVSTGSSTACVWQLTPTEGK